jgi:hypothetical protein
MGFYVPNSKTFVNFWGRPSIRKIRPDLKSVSLDPHKEFRKLTPIAPTIERGKDYKGSINIIPHCKIGNTRPNWAVKASTSSPGEALQILTPSFKKHKEKAPSLSQPTTLSRELSSSTASGQKKFILRNRKQIGKEIFRILYAGKRSASRPFQEFWPLHLDSAIHLMENFAKFRLIQRIFHGKNMTQIL